MTVFVFGYVGMFKAYKIFQFFLVLTSDPTCFEKRQCIKLNRGTVLMKQPVLDHFELKFADTTYYFFIATELCEQLSNAFICQLKQSFFQLLCFHGVFIDNFFK